MDLDLPDHSTSRAVLIGTSSYRDAAFTALPAARNSLHGFRDVLTDVGLCRWPLDRITFFPDPTDVPRLIQVLRRLARETTGILLIYFVGHGVLLGRGQLCLVLADTESSDPDITGLEFQRVRDVILDSPARVKVTILDCCYSGRAIEALSNSGAIADSTFTRGTYTLTASDYSAHVPPLARQEAALTSFTGELVDLVRGGIPGGPRNLALQELYTHLRLRLETRGLPAPNQRGTDTAGLFAFTRNAAWRPAAPARSAEPARTAQDTHAVTGAETAVRSVTREAVQTSRPEPPTTEQVEWRLSLLKKAGSKETFRLSSPSHDRYHDITIKLGQYIEVDGEIAIRNPSGMLEWRGLDHRPHDLRPLARKIGSPVTITFRAGISRVKSIILDIGGNRIIYNSAK